MNLQSKVKGAFDGNTVGRGSDYARCGRVQIVRATGRTVLASVRGSREYSVELILRRHVLRVGCTCPYHADYGLPCKHIWATIVAADAQQALAAAAGCDWIEVMASAGDVLQADLPVDPEDDAPDASDDAEAAADDAEAGGQILRLVSRALPPRPGRQPRFDPRMYGLESRPPRGWRGKLDTLRTSLTTHARPVNGLPAGSELIYQLGHDPIARVLSLTLGFRYRRQDGRWSVLRRPPITSAALAVLPDPVDRRALAILQGGRSSDAASEPWYRYGAEQWITDCYALQGELAVQVLPPIAAAGRLWRLPARTRGNARTPPDGVEPPRLAWDGDEPFEVHLEVQRNDARRRYDLRACLRRGAEQVVLEEAERLHGVGLFLIGARVVRVADPRVEPWLDLLADQSALTVPTSQGARLLEDLCTMPCAPRLDLPPELAVKVERVPARPSVQVAAEDDRLSLSVSLSFLYGPARVSEQTPGDTVFAPGTRQVFVRDLAAEQEASTRLTQLGARQRRDAGRETGTSVRGLPARKLADVTAQLLALGWDVRADGRLYRPPGRFRFAVTTGVDWFELSGSADFDGQTATLPAILDALRRGQHTVVLGDGTAGVLPEEWLRRYAPLAGLGDVAGEAVRFRRAHALLLDALLAELPDVAFDDAFARARDELAAGAGVAAADPAPEFTGVLRGYQREGLGWLRFLDRSGFGGCLADDMGLGKTVQVLAHLAGPRTPGARPALVVAPRSLLFNWRDEAARFAPELRVLDHSGPERQFDTELFARCDLILTTYGIVRRDIARLREIEFGHVILDEAQAIKNADSESAKAVRLLRADRRLALSGTPIENHLGELWSLFEFLNPGMLGRSSLFKLLAGDGRTVDPERAALLARGLRPFLLRRTKAQVAPELPERTEQTLVCQLEPAQRRSYDQLRDYYRRSVLERVERDGLDRARMHVLEALLRLRQIAIHPGLLDAARKDEGSAKLDSLLPHLTEVAERGHKALVFSQFTTMLGIVRDRLERAGVPFQYLDGKTRDRAECVRRFQEDPECRVFLISLKAGGLGLNLTAAEYVFILDPWWNPAVEAQAIDRAHRIGQTRHVMAYRLIAAGTIEEKVVELQRSKRALADAILTQVDGVLRGLTRADLELLLS